jgi:toxin ParE1/3/4
LRRLIWSSPARRDLYRIAAEASSFDPDLPLELLERVEHAPLALLEFPDMGSPTRRRGIRKWHVGRTPFLLFYANSATEVEIRRVVHARSDWDSEF